MLKEVRRRTHFRRLFLSVVASFVVIVATQSARAADRPAASYQFPDQGGAEVMREQDPQRNKLVDGSEDTGVWGRWDVKPYIVDWTFDRPQRIRSIELSIEHPVDPAIDATHPRALHLHVGGDDRQFESEPDLTLPIPFQPGSRQRVTLPLPGDGLIAKDLRTHFEGTNRQIVLNEIRFDTEPAAAEQLAAARQARLAARPEPLKPVDFLPVGRLENVAPPSKTSIFGAAGHMLHTDHFYPGKFSKYWRLEYTLPFKQIMGISSVREPIYQAYFIGDDPKDEPARERNRKLVEQYIADYDRAGIQVVICAIFDNSGEGGTPGGTTLSAFCHWLADMAKRYPCVEAIEIGNEPNLPPFWAHGYQEYVDIARKSAALIREVKPDVPIVVGSFSGMGGVWMRPDLLKEAGNEEKDQAIHWAIKCFEAGLLDFADGVSTHPYPESHTQPEGGIFLQSRKDPNGYEKELVDFWNLVQKYNKSNRPLKLYFTELGYEITSSRDPEWQADYLSRHMLILLSSRISGAIPLQRVHWYDFKEDDEHVGASGWGLLTLNTGHVRPAYVAYQKIAQTFGKTEDFKVTDLRPQFSNRPQVIKHYVWQRESDGAIIVPFWRMEQLQKRDVDFDSGLTLPLPETLRKPSRVEVMDLHAHQALPVGFEVRDGQLRTAVHVTDRAAWLVVHP